MEVELYWMPNARFHSATVAPTHRWVTEDAITVRRGDGEHLFKFASERSEPTVRRFYCRPPNTVQR